MEANEYFKQSEEFKRGYKEGYKDGIKDVLDPDTFSKLLGGFLQKKGKENEK